MRVLVDTNILARIAQPDHVQHAAALEASDAMLAVGDRLYIASQSLYEFWVVATRPLGDNGMGMSVADAHSRITKLRQQYEVLHDSPNVLETWTQLVLAKSVKGKKAHDARLAAVMIANGIRDVLTFNNADFERYPNLVIHVPGKGPAQTAAQQT
jgi:predicted nucleic acid-binding protein